jgi:predicted metal-binding membrane protein
MLLTLAIILFVCWALGFLVFHLTVGLIHLVLVIAVIALIAHFVRGGRRTTV